MLVNCVYKLHSKGEVLEGKYDTDTCRVVGFDDFFVGMIKSDEIRWCRENYEDSNVTVEDLILYTSIYTEAKLIIDYDGIGILLVYDNKCDLVLYSRPMYYTTICEFSSKIFPHDTVPIGLAKTKCKNKNGVQYITYLIVDVKDKDRPVVRRGDGIYDIDLVKFDTDLKYDSDLWLEINFNPDVIGYATVNGVPVPVCVKDNKIEIYEKGGV